MVSKISDEGGVSRCAAHFDLSVSDSCYRHETMRVSGVMAARAMHLIVKASSDILGVVESVGGWPAAESSV